MAPSPGADPRWGGRLGTLLIALAALLCTAPTSALAETETSPVVLVGVPGLLWEDVTPERTPTLWALAGDGAVGNVSIRTATSRTCPVDGWLSVSAGQRASAERARFTTCESAPEPLSDGSGAVVPGHSDLVAANRDSPFAAPVGLLGQTVRDHGGSTLAAGPGAALGAADASGRVDHYLESAREVTPERLDGVSLAVVDLPQLAHLYPAPVTMEDGREEMRPEDVSEEARAEALESLDSRLTALTSALPTGASLMVVGVSMDAGPSRLTAAVTGHMTEHGPAGPSAYLVSESTRRPGLVALTDTTETVLQALGMRPEEPTGGRVWRLSERPATTETSLERLVDFNTAAVVVGAAIPGFFSGLVALQLLIYAAAAYALHRYSDGQRGKRALVLSLTRTVALAGAAFPVASYLANLVPWWSAPLPSLALLLSVLVVDALVVTAAMAGPWRHSALGPMTVVAGATTLVLFLDLCSGAHLQMNSPTGYSPIVGGRFHGIGNIAFATFATGMLMAVAGIAHTLIVRGRRRAAVATALAIGVASVLVIGWPGLGTDFGGVVALIPGLAVTSMMIAGVRVTVPRLAIAGITAVMVITLLSWVDHQRPAAERSHFGVFADQVLHGEAGTVLARKLGAMLGTLGNWQLTLLSAGALVFLFVVLNRPTKWRIGALQRAYEYAPTLRAGLTGSLVTALVGFAANDSGVAIPALALTVAVPLTLSVCVWALQQRDQSAEPEPTTRTDPSPTPSAPRKANHTGTGMRHSRHE